MTKHIWKKKIQGTEKGKKSKDTESEEAGMKNGMKEIVLKCNRDFSSGTVVKNLPCNAGDKCSIPVSGRSPGGRHGSPLQYSCLENPHGQKRLAGYNP